MTRKLTSLIVGIGVSMATHLQAQESLWQQVYDQREAFVEQHIGALPNDILKMQNMMGVWPGGGLYVVPADQLGENLWAYMTFGLSNPDMPASTQTTDFAVETDDQGRVINYRGKLESKTPAQMAAGTPGYGYEFLVLTNENTEWPLWLLQWAVNAEISHDVGLLERVETYQGLTVEQIQIGQNQFVNVLIAKADVKLLPAMKLPNGEAQWLIATVITEEEMLWSKEHGRDALLRKLLEEGHGQISRTP